MQIYCIFHLGEKKKKKKLVIPMWLIKHAYQQLMNISDTSTEPDARLASNQAGPGFNEQSILPWLH